MQRMKPYLNLLYGRTPSLVGAAFLEQILDRFTEVSRSEQRNVLSDFHQLGQEGDGEEDGVG
jgi:hypothetical protein